MKLQNRLFIFLSILSGFLTVQSQTASGDLEAYLNFYIDNVPGSSGDDFSSPTGTDLINWESAVRDILANNIVNARATASLFNYIITEYTDTNNLPGQVYYILEEDSPLSKHWGTYVFNSSPIRDNLVIQTVHARYDTNTGDEAAYSFTRLSAKAFFIQGTHRCNHNTTTSCDGTTSACDSTSKPFSISDLAHNVSTVFQKTTEIVAEDLNTVFVQLHGFSQQGSDPDIIMSNGTDQIPSGTDNVIAMRDELLNVDASLTFKIPHIDIGWTRLIATTNTQGRHLNQSNSPCNTAATSSTGRFVHIEQAFSLRSNSTGWNKIYVALSNLFSDGCATDNTPPVLDCQDLTIQLDNAGNGTLSQAFLNSLATEDCSTATVTASKTNFVCADVISTPANKMVITGVVEGDLNTTNVKAVEVTILQDIQDLSDYGIGSANNGGGTDGQEFTFPVMSALKGDKFLITRDNTVFNTFFGFSADFVDTVAIFFNGDDAIELFYNGSVIDRYGEPNVDGTGKVWEYLNGWAYRKTDTHPDGTIFVSGNWTYSGVGVNTGVTTNIEASPSFPIESYQILPNTQTVILEATDDSGNTSSCVVNVTVEPFETIYSGGSWSNGTPTSATKATVSGNYNTSSGNIEACICEVTLGNTLTIVSGDYVNVQTNIIIDGTLQIEHEGSLVQVDDNAIVTKGINGVIDVVKTTPTLTNRDFTILSSPMTAETVSGVYSAAAFVRNHDTNLFTPHSQVTIDDPLAENFADQEGDNWVIETGSLNAGEGYLVKPFTIASGTTGTYTTNYTKGTLNNGLVNFSTIFGDDQNDSPNILGNPYASSVDANKFITDNPIVDAIYYWEHITAPASDYPGYNMSNYNMGDISLYNGSGGMSAPNEQVGAPVAKPSNQYIPSGQGFGIKANAAGTVHFDNSMRVVDNNSGYRNTEIERIYISVKNITYNLNSSMLVAFTNNATNGYEAMYDAKRLATPVSVYSVLEEKELAIQGRSAFTTEQVIPLGFRTMVEEVQTYTISLGTIEGDNITQVTMYLQDNLLGTVTNLSEGSYIFTSNESNQKDRFVIIFADEQLGAGDVSLEAVSLYPNPTQYVLNIVSPLSTITKVEVYDVQGRVIASIVISNKSTYQLDMSTFNTAMYFVKVTTKDGDITKRVVKK